MARRIQVMIRLTPKQLETVQTIGLELAREEVRFTELRKSGMELPPEIEPTILDNGEVNVSATIRRLLIKADGRLKP